VRVEEGTDWSRVNVRRGRGARSTELWLALCKSVGAPAGLWSYSDMQRHKWWSLLRRSDGNGMKAPGATSLPRCGMGQVEEGS
jgi:hypothetical protein